MPEIKQLMSGDRHGTQVAPDHLPALPPVESDTATEEKLTERNATRSQSTQGRHRDTMSLNLEQSSTCEHKATALVCAWGLQPF